MNQYRKKRSLPVLGGSSLLVIFCVLCLTVLSVLSLETALAQRRLSDSSIEAITAYYRADLEAQTIFARLRGGASVESVSQSEDLYVYTCPISPWQTLYVELKRESDGWKVLRWQAVAGDMLVDENLPVWKEET